jgi:hypothetical protein
MTKVQKHVSFILFLLPVIHRCHVLRWDYLSLVLGNRFKITLFVNAIFVDINFLLHNFLLRYFYEVFTVSLKQLVFKFHVFFEYLFYFLRDHLVFIEPVNLVEYLLVKFSFFTGGLGLIGRIAFKGLRSILVFLLVELL